MEYPTWSERWRHAQRENRSAWRDTLWAAVAAMISVPLALRYLPDGESKILIAVGIAVGSAVLAMVLRSVLDALFFAPSTLLLERGSVVEKELKDTRATITRYEELSHFVVALEHMHLGAYNPEAPKTMLIISLRVTNTGAPGSAFDWRGSLALANGQKFECERLPIETAQQLKGVFAAEIKREELIDERTARRLERNETVLGYLVASIPEDITNDGREENGILEIGWTDNRGNKIAGFMVLNPSKKTSRPVYLVPTLSAVKFNPSLPDAPGPSSPNTSSIVQ